MEDCFAYFPRGNGPAPINDDQEHPPGGLAGSRGCAAPIPSSKALGWRTGKADQLLVLLRPVQTGNLTLATAPGGGGRAAEPPWVCRQGQQVKTGCGEESENLAISYFGLSARRFFLTYRVKGKAASNRSKAHHPARQ